MIYEVNAPFSLVNCADKRHANRKQRRARGEKRNFLSNHMLMGMNGKAYQITSSLLFRGAQYLSRTPSVAGNRQKFTVSVWVRRAQLGVQQHVFSASNGTLSDTTVFGLTFIDTGALAVGGGVTNWRITSALYRDVGSWYHIVCSVDTGTQAINLYVNGTQVTSFSTNTAIASGLQTAVNSAVEHRFGALNYTSPFYSNATFAEPIIVDGAALTPSSFGEFDPVTLNWRPKAPVVSAWGTNGCYLGKKGWTFASLGADSSGNGNNWTATGFLSTDVLADSPTNIYATLNPLTSLTATKPTLSNGNLTIVGPGGFRSVWATLSLKSKTYWEVVMTTSGSGNNFAGIGLGSLSDVGFLGGVAGVIGIRNFDGNLYVNGATNPAGVGAPYGAIAAGATVMYAYDPATFRLWIGKNGTWFNSGDPAAGTGYVANVNLGADVFPVHNVNNEQQDINFGQRAWAYTPPSGYKALCTSNLPAPSAAAKQPWKYYHQQLVVHNGTSSTFTLGWNPDPANGGSHTLFRVKWVNAAGSWVYVDTVRGLTKYLAGETTAAEVTLGSNLININSNGQCSLTSQFAAATYLVEAWRVSPESGFDIVVDQMPASGAGTFNHNNGAAVAHFVMFPRGQAGNRMVNHKGLPNQSTYYLNMTTDAQNSLASVWNNTAPTATQFTLGTTCFTTPANATFVCYVWSEVPGFSKLGSYAGNSSADGALAYLGFSPASFLPKRTDTSAPWILFQQVRNTYNPAVNRFAVNSNVAENDTGTFGTASQNIIDMLSSAAKMRAPDSGVNIGTYAYSAFSRRCIGGQGVSPALAV